MSLLKERVIIQHSTLVETGTRKLVQDFAFNRDLKMCVAK